MSSYVRLYRQPTIDQWAQSSLTADELANFNAALQENNSKWSQYVVNGLITIEPIYETVNDQELGEPLQVQVGDKVVLAPTTSVSDLTMADSYKFWLDRFYQENGPDPVQFVANIA
jgi:hypothetical protein